MPQASEVGLIAGQEITAGITGMICSPESTRHPPFFKLRTAPSPSASKSTVPLNPQARSLLSALCSQVTHSKARPAASASFSCSTALVPECEATAQQCGAPGHSTHSHRRPPHLTCVTNYSLPHHSLKLLRIFSMCKDTNR